MATKHKEKNRQEKTALFIPAGLLIGTGCGLIFHNIVAGLFIGLGIGMIVFAILTFIKK